MLHFALMALAAGGVIVYVLPWAQSVISGIPGIASIAGNKWFQLLIVGAVFLIAFQTLGGILRKTRIA